jgi:hypothetical protein
MNAIQIDRLTIQVSGVTEVEGRRLALQIANGLGAASVGGGHDIPSLRLDLVAGPNMGPDELVRHVVAELVRQVARLP